MPCCRTTRSQTALEQYAASVADDSANEASNEETYESDSIQRGAGWVSSESALIVVLVWGGLRATGLGGLRGRAVSFDAAAWKIMNMITLSSLESSHN